MFENAKAKLNRADKHIADLDREFTDFSRANPDVMKINATRGEYIMAMAPPPLPAALAAALGDAVNNLRASLDMLANDLAAKGAKSKFPFAKDKGKFPKALKESGITDQQVRDYIEFAVMPYGGGDNDVWALHNTDIISKHHTLIPTTGASTVRNVSVTMGDGIVLRDISFAGNGSTVGSTTPIRFLNPGVGSTTPYFTEDSGFGKVPIIPKLRELSKRVRGIVADIEKLARAT